MEVVIHSGMCNRIVSLASMMVAARDFSIPLKVYWPYRETICSVRAADLFDLDRFPKGVVVTDELAPDDSEFWPIYGHEEDNTLKQPRGQLKLNIRVASQPYKKNSKDVHEMIRSLPYKKTVLSAVQKALGKRQIVGVHIRRGDKKGMEEKAPIEAYMALLKTMPDSISFLVCSDEKASVARLKKVFGKRVLAFAKVFDRSSRAGGKDAVRDLLGLSQTNGIIGSPDSSFSRIAAIIGNLPLYKISDDGTFNPNT
jgi:hypothetical protein